MIVGFLNRTSQTREGIDSCSEEELRLWLTSPTNDPRKNARLVFDAGGLVGYADVDPRGSAPTRWWCEVEIDPKGVNAAGAALIAWAEQRAREERPGILAPSKDVFEDSWAHTPTPYEEWLHWTVDKPSFDPTLWFLAFDREELVAICLCGAHPREADLGWVGVLGTRRPRRRGLGLTLLVHAFAVLREHGFPRADLGVDATSLTGANRLHEKAGMRVVRQSDFYERRL